MRFLAKVSFPHEPFSTYVKDGSIDGKMMSILDELKSEALISLKWTANEPGFS